MKRFLLIFLLYLPTIGHSAQGAEPARLTIAAAADLKYAMDEVVNAFKDRHPEATVDLVAGSSGKFYEQIANEAPFDIFFSADVKFPEKLKEQGLTASEVRSYARGRIVLWSATMDAGKMTLQDLADPAIKQIAIANPKHAPYGQRAQEALENAGLWSKVQDKLVFGENIAQTAQFAETGAADVGIIALSLAENPSLKAKGGYYPVPETLHAPLDQAYVILKRAGKNALAGAFADFVATEPARIVFRNHGFILPGEALPDAAKLENGRQSR